MQSQFRYRHRPQSSVAALAALFLAGPLFACSLCGGLANQTSLRQETLQARHVFYGTMSNPRLTTANAAGAANASATDFTIDQVVKSDSAARRAQKKLTIPRYIPVDAAAPPKFLVFCDERAGNMDFYRGTPIKSQALVEYLRGATAIDPKDQVAILSFAGKALDSNDADVAAEAYLEFAVAKDVDVLKVAKSLDRIRLRTLLDDPQTPADRLNLFAYLLGACGNAGDALHMRDLVRQPGDRYRTALGGLYAGLIMLQPNDGWISALQTLGDEKRPFHERNSARNALRFYHNANPTLYHKEVLSGLKSLLKQSDIADLAVEDLRQWKLWNLTGDVLALFDQKAFDAPLMRRGIIRYALSCPEPAAKQFVDRVRNTHADMVVDVEEGLTFEKVPEKSK